METLYRIDNDKTLQNTISYLFIFRFTPYVLAVGTVFLAMTLGIYTKYPKLLNTYTRIMRHYAMTLFFAFTCLWPQQIYKPPTHPLVCKFCGILS